MTSTLFHLFLGDAAVGNVCAAWPASFIAATSSLLLMIIRRFGEARDNNKISLSLFSLSLDMDGLLHRELLSCYEHSIASVRIGLQSTR